MKSKESRNFLETARRTARRVCGANKRKGLLCFALLSTSLFYCDGSGNGSGGSRDSAPPLSLFPALVLVLVMLALF